jgi:two-component system response regulator RegX3
MHIAVLEDDPAQAELLQSWLTTAGHECTLFSLGNNLINALSQDSFDLLILDWNLPDINGTDVLSWVRKNMDWRIPVIFITCRDAEQDVVHALECGADDYMTKPAKQFETLARVLALERRSQSHVGKSGVLEIPPYSFNPKSGIATCHGEQVQLTQKEFVLALYFFRNIGQLLTRTSILENVWDQHADLQTRTIDMHVSRLRNKLNIQPTNGWRLTSVYQHGYRLENVTDSSF